MITPRFYFQRGQKSDRDWIESQMKHVPESRQQEVSDQYEKLYTNNTNRHAGRKLANTYLLNVARECRQNKYVKKNQS